MKQRAMMWTQILCFVAVFVVGALCVIYANQVDQESNQRWCGVVVTLDDAYSQVPPTSPLGLRLAQEMKDLRNGFGC